jgi:hypothetical protein
MNDLLALLLPTLLIAAGTFATCSFVLLRAPISAGWKALAIPASFVSAVAVPLIISGALGRALPAAALPDRSRVLGHQTVIKDGKKQKLEVWVAEPRSPTVLYSVPYSKQLEKLLESAAKGRQQGLQAELLRRQPGSGSEGDKGDGEFGLDFKRPEDLMEPKEGPEEAEEPRQGEEPLQEVPEHQKRNGSYT